MIVDFKVIRTTRKAKDWDWHNDRDVYVFAIKKEGKLFEAVLIRYPCDDYGEMKSVIGASEFGNSDNVVRKMEKSKKLFKGEDEAKNWIYSQMLLEGLL